MTSKNAFQVALGMAVIALFILLPFSSSQEVTTQPPPIESMQDLDELFALEPSYRAIQQAAMRFAEVHPDKIAAWRRGASLRAFLPEVRFRYDLSRRYEIETSTEMETSVRTQYSTSLEHKDETKTGHVSKYGEVLTSGATEIAWSSLDEYTSEVKEDWSSEEKWGSREGTHSSSGQQEEDGKDIDWGIRLDWDLRDFLYSREQPRISREARELVELRQDVLEEINTYFFDRRRAQIQLLFSPPTNLRGKIDLQLRIARITANIDALTGGFLSNKLEEAKGE